MKKTLLLLLVACTTILVSCEKDDEELIIGTWASTEGSYIIENGKYSYDNEDDILTFKRNGTATWVYPGGDEFSGDYYIEGRTLTIFYDRDNYDEFTIIRLNGRKLILSRGDEYNGIHYDFDRD